LGRKLPPVISFLFVCLFGWLVGWLLYGELFASCSGIHTEHVLCSFDSQIPDCSSSRFVQTVAHFYIGYRIQLKCVSVCVCTCLRGSTVLPFSRFFVCSIFLNERAIYALQYRLTGSALLFYLLQYTVLL